MLKFENGVFHTVISKCQLGCAHTALCYSKEVRIAVVLLVFGGSLHNL